MIGSPFTRVLLVACFLSCAATAFAQDPPAPAGHADAAVRLRLPDREARAWQLGLVRPDRLQHASVSLTLGLGCGLLAERPGAAVAGAMSFGVLKELYDIRRTGFDVADLAADLVGAGMATGITAALTR